MSSKTQLLCTAAFGLVSVASLVSPGLAQDRIDRRKDAGISDAQPDEDIVVRITRFATYRGDRVFSAVTLDREVVGASPSVDQALKTVANGALFRRSSSLTANPTIQGMSLRAIAPSGPGRALVTLDGVPLNDPFGSWVIWASVPQEAIDTIHVVRGSGGGAYGGGAITGAVDIGIASPDRALNYAKLTLGGDDNQRIGMGVAGFGVGLYYIGQSLHGSVPVRGQQRGAADVPTSGADRSYLGNWQTAPCVLRYCGRLELLAGTYKSRRDTGLTGATATSTGQYYSLSFTHSPEDTDLGTRLQVWYKTSDLSNRSVSVQAGRTSTLLANDQFKTPATASGFNAAIRSQTTTLELEVGIDGRFNRGTSFENYRYVGGLPTRQRAAGGKTELLGLYSEATATRGTFTLTGAVRADLWRAYGGHRSELDFASGASVLNLQTENQRQVIGSGRLGIGYAITPQMILRAAAYKGFRPPSLNELYRPFRVGNDVTEANAALKPETLDGFDIGLRAAVGEQPRLIVDGDIFFNVLRQPVANVTVGQGPGTFPVAGFIPAGGVLRVRQNVGQISAAGLEANARYLIDTHWRLTSALTVTRARVGRSTQNPGLNWKRPAQAPDYSFTLGTRGQFNRFTVSADLIMDGVSFEDDLNSLRLKPSQKLRATVDWIIRPRLILGLEITNALNNAIQISQSNEGTLGYDDHRRMFASLTYRY